MRVDGDEMSCDEMIIDNQGEKRVMKECREIEKRTWDNERRE